MTSVIALRERFPCVEGLPSGELYFLNLVITSAGSQRRYQNRIVAPFVLKFAAIFSCRRFDDVDLLNTGALTYCTADGILG